MANKYEGMTPLQIFRKIAFELKSYPDDVVQSHIDLAETMFCTEEYGEDSDLFLALMAAHLMVIPGGIAQKQGINGGKPGVKSLREGDLSISYQDTGKATSLTDWLMLSRFGQMINMMRRQRGLNLGLTANGFECYEDGGYYFPNRAIH